MASSKVVRHERRGPIDSGRDGVVDPAVPANGPRQPANAAPVDAAVASGEVAKGGEDNQRRAYRECTARTWGKRAPTSAVNEPRRTRAPTLPVIASRTPPRGYGNASRFDGALSRIRICDLSGQLAGAGATRLLAAFGAQVIRIEDPVTRGLWDIVRELPPRIAGDRTPEGGSGFNNHNVEKLGVTIDLRTERGKDLLRRLVRASAAVTETFAAGVMDRLGFGYDALQALKPDIVYVSNSGFGATGPYRSYKSWGPIAQAMSGLTWSSGLPDREPAG